MDGARSQGELDKDKIMRRMQNLLNIAYLSAEPQGDGSFKLPYTIINDIETELDFSPPEEKTKKAREEAVKKRYRKWDSYTFFKESLDRANIATAHEAKDFLLSLFHKLDKVRYYGSMTHSSYALETLNLAVDDMYGTSSLVLTQYKYNLNKSKKSPKKAKKTSKRKKSIKKTPSTLNMDSADFCPF